MYEMKKKKINPSTSSMIKNPIPYGFDERENKISSFKHYRKSVYNREKHK